MCCVHCFTEGALPTLFSFTILWDRALHPLFDRGENGRLRCVVESRFEHSSICIIEGLKGLEVHLFGIWILRTWTAVPVVPLRRFIILGEYLHLYNRDIFYLTYFMLFLRWLNEILYMTWMIDHNPLYKYKWNKWPFHQAQVDNGCCLSGRPTLGIAFLNNLVRLETLSPDVPVYFLEVVVSPDLHWQLKD